MATLAGLPADVRRPAYDRARLHPGIVHIGPGAFHRAHQAALVDTLLDTDPRWAITTIALRSRETAETLQRQDGLFTLKTLGEGGETRVVGAITGALCASDAPAAALAALTSAATRLVTLTITEKGYCLDAGGRLDHDHVDIRHDLAGPRTPKSAIGWLVAGLAARKDNGLAPPVILSCDNLEANGTKLAGALHDFARETDRGLADWIADRVLCPRTMVDSITPASDHAFLDCLEAELGVRDGAAVKREVFTSWVIEKADAGAVTALGNAGALLSGDVAGHALVKLRVLNGAHSALAWTGLAAGRSSVADAMADITLRAGIDRLIHEEILPGLPAPDGLDLNAYARTVLNRFANPDVSHLLSQIAWDSSQKLPIRLLGTVQDNLAAGRPVRHLARAVAAWMRLVVRSARDGTPLTDPMADRLMAAGRTCSGNADEDTARFLRLEAVFSPALAQDQTFRNALVSGYRDVLALERGERA